MAERETQKDKSDPDKKTGKFHYDPVGMSGKEAGKFKEHDEEQERQERQEQAGDDSGERLGKRKT